MYEVFPKVFFALLSAVILAGAMGCNATRTFVGETFEATGETAEETAEAGSTAVEGAGEIVSETAEELDDTVR